MTPHPPELRPIANKLCQHCHQMTQADFIRVTALVPVPHQEIFVPVQDETTISESQRRFRNSWPTSRILDELQLERTIEHSINLLLPKSFEQLRTHGFQQGCHLCCHILQYIDGPENPALAANTFLFPLLVRVDDIWRHRVNWELRYGILTSDRSWLPWPDFFLDFELHELESEAVDALEEMDNCTVIQSDVDWSKLRGWLKDCLATHEDCGGLDSGPDLKSPSRFVKIAQQDGSFALKLVDVLDVDEHGGFAALSHCWGPEGPPIKLIQANHSQWLEDIPFEDMSRTFQDSIVAAFALGLRYIWIDALCIVQDSHQDWQNESAAMRYVYSKAKVTLAATASRDGSGGLFVQRAISRPDVPIRWLRKDFTVLGISNLSIEYDKNIDRSPLHQRAWVFQETVLSRRILHFTASGVWYQCSQGLWLHGGRNSLELSKVLEHERQPRNFSWIDMVEVYSAKKLTFWSDRLVALAGIAEFYAHKHELPPQSFFAGLWQHEMNEQLLWQRHANHLAAEVDSQSAIAPTWSWASYNGPVSFPFHKSPGYNFFNHCFEVRGLENDHSLTKTPFITARTVLHRFQLNSLHLEIRVTVNARSTLDLEFLYIPHDWLESACSLEQLHTATHCIPVLWQMPVTSERFQTFVLLLLRRQDEDSGVFCRSGMVPIVFAPGMGVPRWWKPCQDLEQSDYLAKHTNGTYTIKII